MGGLVYKIVDRDHWAAAAACGRYRGSADDLRDGYVHLSTAAQVRATAARHFAGRAGLVLLAVDPARLGEALRWETSRGGDLFPHLYAPLPARAVVATHELPLAPGGGHVFPDSIP